MLPFVKILAHKEHFNQRWATPSYGGHDPAASSFLPGCFCRPWRGRHHGPADVKAWMTLNVVITQRGSAAGFHANDRQGCYTCELQCQRQQQAGTFTAWLSQKAAALIQTNTFGCSFGSRRLNWPPVCASSSVFYCSFTTEISPLWDQIKVFLFIFVVYRYRRCPDTTPRRRYGNACPACFGKSVHLQLHGWLSPLPFCLAAFLWKQTAENTLSCRAASAAEAWRKKRAAKQL